MWEMIRKQQQSMVKTLTWGKQISHIRSRNLSACLRTKICKKKTMKDSVGGSLEMQKGRSCGGGGVKSLFLTVCLPRGPFTYTGPTEDPGSGASVQEWETEAEAVECWNQALNSTSEGEGQEHRPWSPFLSGLDSWLHCVLTV